MQRDARLDAGIFSRRDGGTICGRLGRKELGNSTGRRGTVARFLDVVGAKWSGAFWRHDRASGRVGQQRAGSDVVGGDARVAVGVLAVDYVGISDVPVSAGVLERILAATRCAATAGTARNAGTRALRPPV